MVQIKALLQFLHISGLEKGRRDPCGIIILLIFALTLVIYSFNVLYGGVHNPSLLSHYAGHLDLVGGSSQPYDASAGTSLRSHHVGTAPSTHSLEPHDRPNKEPYRTHTPPSSHRPSSLELDGDQEKKALHSHNGKKWDSKHPARRNGRSNEESLHLRGIEPLKLNHPQELGDDRPIEDSGHKCEGKYVYIYKLPPEFNEDLIDKCGRSTNNWAPLCGNLNNNGYGPSIPTSNFALNDTNTDTLFDLEPPHAWYRTEQFSLELLFHERLRRGYPCLTQNPELASGFYIPYYAALDTAFTLFDPHMPTRDRLVQRLVGWLSGSPVWAKFQGVKRHFMVLGRIAWDFNRNEELLDGWGSALLSQVELSNVTRLLIERRPWMPNEIAIPYPTSFHPSSLRDMELWQEKLRGGLTGRRGLLCSYIGSTSRGTEWSRALRVELAKQCDRVGTSTCQEYKCGDGNGGTVDCTRNPERVNALFLSSTFCLQPSGDSPTRKGIFDSLLAGCIPILFTPSSAYTQYMWHLPRNGSLYSVLFDGNEVVRGDTDIFATLSRIANNTQQLRLMQEEVIRMLPRMVYSLPGNHSYDHNFHDAVDVALENLLGGSPIPTVQ